LAALVGGPPGQYDQHQMETKIHSLFYYLRC
jgi:hypothetical protein